MVLIRADFSEASVDFVQEDNEMVLAEIELCMLYEAESKYKKEAGEL